MKTINIDKVIRGIKLDYCPNKNKPDYWRGYNDAHDKAIQIIKDNIKEVEDDKYDLIAEKMLNKFLNYDITNEYKEI